MSRVAAFWACLATFVGLTIALITCPALGDLDESITHLHPKTAWAPLVPWVRGYELVGQRGPTLLVCTPLIVWWAWRRRDRAPFVALVVAELLLNLSVGVLKLGLGRVGPFSAGDAHRFFAGGDIYPSGHVSNAVVLYGLLAGFASPRRRRLAVACAVFLSATVGIGTVLLRTHWFTDVLGGWLSGALVLLAVPSILPRANRIVDRFGCPGGPISAVRRHAVEDVGGVLGAEMQGLVPRERTGSNPQNE